MSKTCLDCGKEIYPRSTRCTSCTTKRQWQDPQQRQKKIIGLKRSHPRYPRPKCIDCGIQIKTLGAQRCTSCSARHNATGSYFATNNPSQTTKGRERLRQKAIAQWQDSEARSKLMDGIRRRSESEEWRSAPHFQRGAAHPRYKGNKRERLIAVGKYKYKQWRQDVFKKHDYTCQDCKERGSRLVAHHIKSWADFPALRYDVDNGMALCEKCHDKVHGRKHRPKQYHCIDCGKEKTDGRRSRCRSCGAKYGNKHR